MDDLQKVLRRVARSAESPQQPVNPIGSTGDYPSKIGVGSKTASTQPSVSSNVEVKLQQWVEAVSVYSYIVVTEDGAFELPPSWPTSGTYRVPGQTYSTIPGVLSTSGSVYVLDTTAATYKQRRVHSTYFKHKTKDELYSHVYHIQIEQPYNKLAYVVGHEIFGNSFTINPLNPTVEIPSVSNLLIGTDIKTYMAVNPATRNNPSVKALIDMLNNLGLVEEP